MSIVAERLVKRFDEADEDAPPAVDGLSFTVAPGEIYGLIGPNGAGKTTTMRMLVGLMNPTAGRATIAGRDLASDGLAARRQVGFVSGSMGLYERLEARELLRYQAQLYGMSRRDADARIDALAAMLHFEHLLRRRSGGLSTGEKQRVALARASVHDPPALIFDEPTAGLDVLASRFVADFIRGCKDRGRAVLFSTHYMTEAELLCDRIGLLHRGRLLAEGTAAELKERLDAETLEEVFLRLHDGEG
jgi:sodium transport system ATP-binding protein